MERLKWSRWTSLLLMSMSVVACGGGGGSGDSQRIELSVSVTGLGRVTSQPAGIDCGAGCSSSFDVGTTVTLTATPTAGQVFAGWDGACAGTTSTCSLAMGAARAASARFESAPPVSGWGDVVRFTGAGVADSVVAIDAAGRATAVWRRLEPGTGEYHVWSSRSAADGAWSAPERLESNPGNVSELRLSVDRASGRGMLVWVQAGTTVDLHARALDPTSGWAPAALVETGSGMVGVSSVGVDAGGNALAVWSQIGPGLHFSIFANRYVPASGWGAAAPIETNEVVGVVDGDPIVAVMPSGDAVAVWKRSAGNWSDLWTNRYAAAGSSWGTASHVVADTGTAQSIGRFDLAADANGRALLVWGQLDVAGGTADNAIWFKRFAAVGWQTNATRLAPAVANTQGFISTPVLRLNGAGAAVVTWIQSDTSLSAAAAPPNGPFGTAITLRTAGRRPWMALPSLGLDAAGGAILAWADPDSFDLMATRLIPSSGWTPAAANESYADPSFGPALAMNEAGNAVLAWPQVFPDSDTELVIRRYASGR
jgi:Divergent InlB B-repeat domain